MRGWLGRFKARAKFLKGELGVLWLAARDPRTPRAARWLIAATLAYALSPIDLIPDFIPVLGMVDDLILLPLALALAIRLIPPRVIDDCRRRAYEADQESLPKSCMAAVMIFMIWIVIVVLTGVWAYDSLRPVTA